MYLLQILHKRPSCAHGRRHRRLQNDEAMKDQRSKFNDHLPIEPHPTPR